MKKRLLFLTTIMLFVVAVILFIPNHSWAAPGESSNIRIIYTDGEDSTIEKYIYDASGNNSIDTTIEGIKYDSATNTLILDEFNGPEIFVENMGNDFKIKLMNDNQASGIQCMGEYIQVDESTGMQDWGNLEINGTGKLLIKGLGTIMTKDLTINDATINIITEGLEENMHVGAIRAHGNLKINSGNISIEGANEGLYSTNLEIAGGNISITVLENAIYAENILIKGGNIEIESGVMGIIGNKVEFRGGETTIDAGMCAVLTEHDTEGAHIVLVENMVVEEETSIKTIEIINNGYYITTFGTDEISVNVESGEITSASKKVTIKEKQTINNNETEDENNKTTNNDNIKENENKKDETPDTGIEEIKNEILLYSLVLLILVCAIVITKSKK